MQFIDTHCHLYLKEFNGDQAAVMERAKLTGVQKFFLPAINSEVLSDMLLMESRYPENCFAMIGLHPCSVKDNVETELQLVKEWLAKRPFKAIGEIGLDFYWDITYAHRQIVAFEQQMELALHYNLPVVIHTRNAMQQSINIVQPFAGRGLQGIFHCFGDGIDMANKIIEMGFLLGIGGVVTYKKAGLAEVLADIDLKYIVLETDAPYLSPVPYRGKRNESSYLIKIAEKIAEIKGISVEEVAEITTANAEKLFGL